ncbi:hypothetical protein ACT8ZV_22175 [Nocardioides sp. MAHUQ-72]|uniref:hypothetical protein n=1 Tax=unclassified Nocardioides TaxID=2615069 RepID=UPI00361D97EE
MRYEVHVAGLVPSEQLAEEVAGLGEAGVVEHEVCTVLSGTFADQAALHGFLHRLWARRLQVVQVRRTRRRQP